MRPRQAGATRALPVAVSLLLLAFLGFSTARGEEEHLGQTTSSRTAGERLPPLGEAYAGARTCGSSSEAGGLAGAAGDPNCEAQAPEDPRAASEVSDGAKGSLPEAQQNSAASDQESLKAGGGETEVADDADTEEELPEQVSAAEGALGTWSSKQEQCPMQAAARAARNESAERAATEENPPVGCEQPSEDELDAEDEEEGFVGPMESPVSSASPSLEPQSNAPLAPPTAPPPASPQGETSAPSPEPAPAPVASSRAGGEEQTPGPDEASPSPPADANAASPPPVPPAESNGTAAAPPEAGAEASASPSPADAVPPAVETLPPIDLDLSGLEPGPSAGARPPTPPQKRILPLEQFREEVMQKAQQHQQAAQAHAQAQAQAQAQAAAAQAQGSQPQESAAAAASSSPSQSPSEPPAVPPSPSAFSSSSAAVDAAAAAVAALTRSTLGPSDPVPDAASSPPSEPASAPAPPPAAPAVVSPLSAEAPFPAERFNYASFDSGAKVLSANPEAQGSSAVLVEDKDKYMLTPCGAPEKQLVVELSEEILITTLSLANFEYYSSSFKDFQLFGSNTYPVRQWAHLGDFRAQSARGVQRFLVPHRAWVRYLRIRFLSHYGREYYCTLSQIKVHGNTMLEDLKSEIERSSEEVHRVNAAIAKTAAPAPPPPPTPPVAAPLPTLAPAPAPEEPPAPTPTPAAVFSSGSFFELRSFMQGFGRLLRSPPSQQAAAPSATASPAAPSAAASPAEAPPAAPASSSPAAPASSAPPATPAAPSSAPVPSSSTSSAGPSSSPVPSAPSSTPSPPPAASSAGALPAVETPPPTAANPPPPPSPAAASASPPPPPPPPPRRRPGTSRLRRPRGALRAAGRRTPFRRPLRLPEPTGSPSPPPRPSRPGATPAAPPRLPSRPAPRRRLPAPRRPRRARLRRGQGPRLRGYPSGPSLFGPASAGAAASPAPAANGGGAPAPAAAAAPAPPPPLPTQASYPSPSSESIFRTLTNKIKSLEINQSIITSYLSELNARWMDVFSDLQSELERLQSIQAANHQLVVNSSRLLAAARQQYAGTDAGLARLRADIERLAADLRSELARSAGAAQMQWARYQRYDRWVEHGAALCASVLISLALARRAGGGRGAERRRRGSESASDSASDRGGAAAAAKRRRVKARRGSGSGSRAGSRPTSFAHSVHWDWGAAQGDSPASLGPSPQWGDDPFELFDPEAAAASAAGRPPASVFQRRNSGGSSPPNIPPLVSQRLLQAAAEEGKQWQQQQQPPRARRSSGRRQPSFVKVLETAQEGAEAEEGAPNSGPSSPAAPAPPAPARGLQHSQSAAPLTRRTAASASPVAPPQRAPSPGTSYSAPSGAPGGAGAAAGAKAGRRQSTMQPRGSAPAAQLPRSRTFESLDSSGGAGPPQQRYSAT
eukprot:tig00020904_g15260.t1